MKAYSVYTPEEMATALKMAFRDVHFVDTLDEFMNFSDSVDNLLNTAHQTPGCLSCIKT
jgi:hypothetical protein